MTYSSLPETILQPMDVYMGSHGETNTVRLQVDPFLVMDGAVTPIHSAVSFFVMCFASTFVPPTSSVILVIKMKSSMA